MQPKPCPFCGEMPTVGPEKPEVEGNAFGYVRCINKKCVANPIVYDAIKIADNRGVEKYKQAAIKRWNRRSTGEQK